MEDRESTGTLHGLRESSGALNQAPAQEARPLEQLLLYSQARFILIGLTMLAVLGSMVALPPIIGMNDASRWSTAWAMSIGQGYVIDGSPYETCDKVFRDGHFYSSKPALMPTVVGLLTKAFTLNGHWSFQYYERYFVRVILLILNVLPLGILLILYDRMLERWKLSASVRLFCLTAAALGTYVTAYSTTLNNHTQAAWAVFFSVYCLMRILETPNAAAGWYAACGLLASWAAVNENPAIAYVVILAGILLWKRARPTLAYFLPMIGLMLVAYFYTTYQATGRFYPYSLNYDRETYYTYPGSVWPQPRGIDAQAEPKWWYAFNLILGHHGLLSLTPIFLLSVWGMIRHRDAFTNAHRLVNNLGLVLLVSITVLYIFATSNYGGGCQGPRWLLWLTPFLLISMPQVVQKHFHSRAFRTFAYLALFVSLYSISYALVKGPWGDARDSWLHWVFRYMHWIEGY